MTNFNYVAVLFRYVLAFLTYSAKVNHAED